MKIAILGSNSIAGNFISQKLTEAEIEVTNYSKSLLNFDLHKLDEIDLDRFDFVVDFAYKYDSTEIQFNKEIEIKNRVLNDFTSKYIYISSLSSGEHNNSIYSRQKKNLEILIKNNNQLVIKIGWLYDKSENISTRQSNLIKRIHSLIPVTLDNKSTYYATSFGTLQKTIFEVINNPNFFSSHNIISIFDKKYLGIALFLNGQFGFLPKKLCYIPSKPFFVINGFLEYFKIRIVLWDRISNFFMGMIE
jgi:hypothetical protein